MDFTNYHHFENNIESQQIFEENKEKFSKQCRIVLEAFFRGERLTTATALIKYGIGDLRRRVKDLKDFWNIPVQSETQKGGYKEFFL